MRMQNAESLTEEQIRQFLTSSETIEFRGQNRAELYGWVERVLVAQEYATRGKKQRGAVRAYIVKMTGLSLPQATRLIRQYRADGVVEAAPYRRRRFPVKYTSQDVARLAEVDRAHGWLSGPATVRISSASTNNSARPNMRVWEKSRWRTCTTCAAATDTGSWRRSGTDAAHRHPDRGAAPTQSAGPARLSAHRHRAPRRLEWSQRGVSHQCRGCGDAVAGGGLCGPDQRATSAASIGGDTASISLSDSGISYQIITRIKQRIATYKDIGTIELLYVGICINNLEVETIYKDKLIDLDVLKIIKVNGIDQREVFELEEGKEQFYIDLMKQTIHENPSKEVKLEVNKQIKENNENNLLTYNPEVIKEITIQEKIKLEQEQEKTKQEQIKQYGETQRKQLEEETKQIEKNKKKPNKKK